MSDQSYVPLDEPQPGAIRPESVASQIAALRRLAFPSMQAVMEQQPRTIEALWFIQWRSMQPGGLEKFAQELLEFISPRLATKSMRGYGSRKYTEAECLAVWEEMPGTGELEAEVAQTRGYRTAVEALFAGTEPKEIEQVLKSARWSNDRPAPEHFQEVLAKLLYQRNEPYLRQLCQRAHRRDLAKLLENLCTGNEFRSATQVCPDLIAEVLAFAGAHAARMAGRIAKTTVTDKVFDALDYACAERVMVRIEGESRFGKTESVETYAAMWPGRVRVVRTPSSNNEKDLFKAVAEALGIHHSHGTAGQTLKDKVEFVIRFSGLMLIFDEAAFLIPSNFSATTPPARLNWVRTAIVDRKIPVVLVVTPQSYHSAVARFVKKTAYSIEQFIGREALRIALPNDLAHEDLLAVARIHFPGADEDLLGLVAAMALQSESYLKAVENIARRARFNATKRGAKKFALRDVEQAISEVMPATAAASAPPVAPKPKPAAKLPRRRSGAAAVLQAPFGAAAKDFTAREIVPLQASPEGAEALATG